MNAKIQITFPDGTVREYTACAENSIHLIEGGTLRLLFKDPQHEEMFKLSKHER
jgi:hypothetical protein